MSTGDIVRRVIVQTEIQPVQGGGSPSSSRGAASSTSPSGRNTRLMGEKQVTSELDNQNRKVTAHAKMLDRMHKHNLSMIKAEAGMRLETERNIERVRDASERKRLSRIKFAADFRRNVESANERFLQDQAKRTQQILGQARRQGEYLSPQQQRIRSLVEGTLEGRRRRGEPLNIGGRGGAGGRVDYFSTGNKTLDSLNQKGFSAFITMMTATMIGNALKGGLDFGAGLGSGEGAGISAQINRFIKGFPSKEDERSGAFGWGKRTVRGISNLTMMPFLPEQVRNRLIDAAGYGPDKAVLDAQDLARRQSLMSGGGSLSGMALSSAGRGVAAGDEMQSRISNLYKMAEQSLTKEERLHDKEIREKRGLLREEVSAMRQRLDLTRSETQGIMGQREQFIQAWGTPGKKGFENDRELFRKVMGGAGPEQLTKEERARINQSPDRFGRMQGNEWVPFRDAFAQNAFVKQGGNDLLNEAGLNQAAFASSRQQANAARDAVGFATDSIFKAELNIDKVVAEIKGLETDFAEVMAPIIKDFIVREVKDLKDQMEDGRLKEKIGNAQGGI